MKRLVVLSTALAVVSAFAVSAAHARNYSIVQQPGSPKPVTSKPPVVTAKPSVQSTISKPPAGLTANTNPKLINNSNSALISNNNRLVGNAGGAILSPGNVNGNGLISNNNRLVGNAGGAILSPGNINGNGLISPVNRTGSSFR